MGKRSKSIVAESSADKQPSDSETTTDTKWNAKYHLELLKRVQEQIPSDDFIPFEKRLENIDWKKVRFPPFIQTEAQKEFFVLLEECRPFRLLSELISDTQSRIWANLPNPTKPAVSSYQIFISEKKNEIKNHLNNDLIRAKGGFVKKAAELFSSLPDQEKEVYKKTAERRLSEYIDATQNLKKVYGLKKQPTANITPYKLYVQELKSMNADIKTARKDYHDMPSSEKIKWILKTLNVDDDQTLTAQQYLKANEILNKDELSLVDEYEGRPKHQSAYNIFMKQMFEKNKNRPAGDILRETGAQWKGLSEKKKAFYSEMSKRLKDEYREKYNQFLKSLPACRLTLEKLPALKKKRVAKKQVLVEVNVLKQEPEIEDGNGDESGAEISKFLEKTKKKESTKRKRTNLQNDNEIIQSPNPSKSNEFLEISKKKKHADSDSDFQQFKAEIPSPVTRERRAEVNEYLDDIARVKCEVGSISGNESTQDRFRKVTESTKKTNSKKQKQTNVKTDDDSNDDNKIRTEIFLSPNRSKSSDSVKKSKSKNHSNSDSDSHHYKSEILSSAMREKRDEKKQDLNEMSIEKYDVESLDANKSHQEYVLKLRENKKIKKSKRKRTLLQYDDHVNNYINENDRAFNGVNLEKHEHKSEDEQENVSAENISFMPSESIKKKKSKKQNRTNLQNDGSKDNENNTKKRKLHENSDSDSSYKQPKIISTAKKTEQLRVFSAEDEDEDDNNYINEDDQAFNGVNLEKHEHKSEDEQENLSAENISFMPSESTKKKKSQKQNRTHLQNDGSKDNENNTKKRKLHESSDSDSNHKQPKIISTAKKTEQLRVFSVEDEDEGDKNLSKSVGRYEDKVVLSKLSSLKKPPNTIEEFYAINLSKGAENKGIANLDPHERKKLSKRYSRAKSNYLKNCKDLPDTLSLKLHDGKV